ncbi:MAG: hypothetical protein E7462_07140 [Ruminococcaceae bacterium]|nr:hypothetical protein [Oscillospiraceae bacterium]
MDCCRLNCGWIAVLVGILAGVVLGILYALGFIATGIIFWAYLGIGVLGLLLTPLYASAAACDGSCRCFARYRGQIFAGLIGTILAAAVGLIVLPLAGVAVIAIVLGVATLFAVLFLATLVCLTECLN